MIPAEKLLLLRKEIDRLMTEKKQVIIEYDTKITKAESELKTLEQSLLKDTERRVKHGKIA